MSAPDAPPQTVHAGLIAAWTRGGWRGLLIEGPSGVGKSDLALRALAAGFRLAADDRVILWRDGPRLFGRAPDVLAGLIEVRGLGVSTVAALPFAPVSLVVTCRGNPGETARLPDPPEVVRLGVRLPLLELWPFEPGALAKLSHAATHLGARP